MSSSSSSSPWQRLLQYHQLSKLYNHHHHGGGGGDTEGFRDAIRRGNGGQQDDYMNESIGTNTNTTPNNKRNNAIVGEYLLSSSSPIITTASQSSSSYSTTSKEYNNNIPFPKLTPGRKRNYHPPHVISAILCQQQNEYHVKENNDHINKDDEMTNFIENFRDGKKLMMMENIDLLQITSTTSSYNNDDNNDNYGMISPKKSSSDEAIRRVLPQQQQQQQQIVDNDTEEEDNNYKFDDNTNNYRDIVSSDDSSEKTVKQNNTWSTTLLLSTSGEEVGSDSERFRDDLRSSRRRRGAGHSGSDVNIVSRTLLINGGGGGGGGGTNNSRNNKSGLGNNLVVGSPPPLPLSLKSILTSHYSSSSSVSDNNSSRGGNGNKIGNKSMNFRDGNTRLATYYKDEAFSSGLVDYDATLKDEEEDDEEVEEEKEDKGGNEEGKMEENDVDSRYYQGNTEKDSTVFNADGTYISSPNTLPNTLTSKMLLSIDPRSIDIIPLSTGRAVEESELSKIAASSTTTNTADRSNIIPDPFSGEMLFHPHGESGAFVKMFRGSASYIANHRKTTAVYHIPGELLSWEGFPGLMDDIALTWLLGMKIVLVAGCRQQIDLRLYKKSNDEEMNGMGMLNKVGEINNGDINITDNKQDVTLEQQPEQGFGGHVVMSSIHVTDDETLRVVKEEAGYVRFEIERRLAKSLRLHGGLVKGSESLVGNVVSGNFYSAQPFGVVDGLDYCWTGFPRKVEIERIKQVHETNDIVLLTSLGVSPSGEIFNVNSEFLAATVAGAMSASKIVYFNVHGTSFQHRHTKKPVQNLRVSDAKNLLAHYKMRIHPKGFALVDLDERDTAKQMVLRTPGSMETLIKLGYSMVALEKGVQRAHILAPENGALVQELYTRDGCGTLISRDIYEGIRRADVNDVSRIYDLIDPLVRMGTLVPRPKSTLEKEILSYYVFTRDGLILATGQLKRYEGGFAEISCLVVSSEYRRGGRGDAMLGYLERLSLQCGATKVFVLSTQTMEWFVERGFMEVPVEVSEMNLNDKVFLNESCSQPSINHLIFRRLYYRACHQVDKLCITRNERVRFI